MPKLKLSREPESDLAKMSNRDLVRITRQRCKLSIQNTHVGKYLKELLYRVEKLETENEQ